METTLDEEYRNGTACSCPSCFFKECLPDLTNARWVLLSVTKISSDVSICYQICNCFYLHGGILTHLSNACQNCFNQVIINSEVWDLRKFRLLRSVPSLDQTAITFNGRGDVIYAILRRNIEDVMSAVHTRRVKHNLFSAFRTVDAVNYSDIATIPVDRCVLDFATEPTDSSVGLISMDDQDEMFASARIYEIGRRRPTDDDSDPDDAESEEEDEDDDDDDDDDVDPLLGPGLGGDSESDADDLSNDEDDDSIADLDDDVDDDESFIMDDLDFDGGTGILEIVTEGDEDEDDSQTLESLSSGEEDFVGNGFGF